MRNSQELYCFLQDYHLTKPNEDNWQSIQNAVLVWVDCWWNGSVPTYDVDDNKMMVTIDGEQSIRMEWLPPNELKIECVDDETEGGWYGDEYPLWR